jgi:hypothetical protein
VAVLQAVNKTAASKMDDRREKDAFTEIADRMVILNVPPAFALHNLTEAQN